MLTLPEGRPPFPLVLHVHGGPIGTVDDRFPGVLDALLLSRGFAILAPNPRGSAGRGQAFASAVVGDMGGADVDDVLAGVDAAVAAGHADPERLVLTGGSYGGFMAAWIPTVDGRFKAVGVDLAGHRLVVRAVRLEPRRVGGRLPRGRAARGARGVHGPQPGAGRRSV